MNPFVCIRCAASSSTCCRLEPGQEEFCFPLSDLEKERIHEYAPGLGAFAVAGNSSAFVANVIRLFPNEPELIQDLFPEKKTHFRLATSRDGSCKLLSGEGCILPDEVRPYYCRLFPVWMSGGQPMVFAAQGCLAVRESRSLPRLLESLGLTVAKVRDLHSRLRLAWGLPPAEGMPMVIKPFARFSK